MFVQLYFGGIFVRKFIKWLGVVFGGLLGLLLVILLALSLVGGARLTRTYDVQVEAITIPTDAESI